MSINQTSILDYECAINAKLSVLSADNKISGEIRTEMKNHIVFCSNCGYFVGAIDKGD